MKIKNLVNINNSVSLLKMLHENPTMLLEEIADELKVSVPTVKRLFKKLDTLGVEVQNIGSRRKPKYLIVNWGVIDMKQVIIDKTLR